MKQEIDKLKKSDQIKLFKNGCLNYEVELLNFFRRVTLSVVLEVIIYLILIMITVLIMISIPIFIINLSGPTISTKKSC